MFQIFLDIQLQGRWKLISKGAAAPPVGRRCCCLFVEFQAPPQRPEDLKESFSASLGEDKVLALFLYLLNESATSWRLCKCVTVIASCTSIFSSVYFTVCHINCWHATTHNISRNPWIIKSQLLLFPVAEGILSVPLFIQSLLNQHKL